MSRTSRRQFAKSIAVAAAAGPLVVAQSAVPRPIPPVPPPVPPAPGAVTPAAPSPLGRAYTDMVRATYGQHLTPAELERIGSDFNEAAPYVESFRKFKLANADEPDFTFQPLAERW
jgi:hypothetical protein